VAAQASTGLGETIIDTAATITAIIPVLGETGELQRLLELLRNLSDPVDEIIVVDGLRHDDCRNLCKRYGCDWLPTRCGRGHQLHAGALQASSDILWFVHADAAPGRTAATDIRRHIASGCDGGYFRFRFSGTTNAAKRALAAMINLRTTIGIPYGDQGLFATRSAYMEAGGFPDQPLFEEVRLVRNLRRRRRFLPVAATIGVSQRRWQRDGWVRRSCENRLLAAAYTVGISPQTLARRYHPAGHQPESYGHPDGRARP